MHRFRVLPGAAVCIDVQSPPIPKDAEEILKKEGVLKLNYGVGAKTTEAFDEWAEANGVEPLSLEFTEQGIFLTLATDRDLVLYKMWWE